MGRRYQVVWQRPGEAADVAWFDDGERAAVLALIGRLQAEGCSVKAYDYGPGGDVGVLGRRRTA